MLPIEIDHLKRRKCTASIRRPRHTIVFLALRDKKVICFFHWITGIPESKFGSQRIASDSVLFPVEISQKVIKPLLTLDLVWIYGRKVCGSAGDITYPKIAQKLFQNGIAFILSAERLAESFLTPFLKMEPVKNDRMRMEMENRIDMSFEIIGVFFIIWMLAMAVWRIDTNMSVSF